MSKTPVADAVRSIDNQNKHYVRVAPRGAVNAEEVRIHKKTRDHGTCKVVLVYPSGTYTKLRPIEGLDRLYALTEEPCALASEVKASDTAPEGFIVLRPSQGVASACVHKTAEDARREADELASKNVGATFYVMQFVCARSASVIVGDA